MRVPLLVAALVVAGSTTFARAQVFTWQQFTPASAPGARSDHALAYDVARQRTVMFGGMHANGTTWLGDTWEWDGTDWLARISNHYPPPRRQFALAHDPLRQRTVLFGGWSGSVLADTWEWDGTDWTQANPVAEPPARFGHAMAWDGVRQRVVLFGGHDDVGYSNQMWEWDGSAWSELVRAAPPPARALHAMAWDPVRQRVVLSGGVGNGGGMADVWEWDGAAWAPTAPAGAVPIARWSHGLVFDVARGRITLFGGVDSTGGAIVQNDTWEWDGVAWTQQAPLQSPPARRGHGIAYDAARQRVVVFGGFGGAGVGALADTWGRGTLGTPATATAYGSGCGAPAVTFVPHPFDRPIVGAVATAEIHNGPTQVGGVAMGWNDDTFGPFTLPLPLGGIGMPGCTLLTSGDVFGLPVAPWSGGALRLALSIPNAPALIGNHAYLQAYVMAPGANELGLRASNGIDWRFGDV